MKLLLPAVGLVGIMLGLVAWAPADSLEIDTSFDSTFFHIYTHTASNDLPGAVRSADSLFQEASTDVNRIRALMLIGDMYHRMAKRDSVIHYATRASRIAERSRIYAWQARIYGVLSTQYREMGLLAQGRKYLAQGLKASDQMETPEAVSHFKGQVYQEMGFYDIAENNYEQAIAHFIQASSLFEQVPPSAARSFGLIQNEERMGVCYTNLGQLDSALHHFHKALHVSDEATDANTPLKGLVHSGLGRVFLLQHNRVEAFDHLKKALEIAEASKFPNLVVSVYKNLADYYHAVGDMEAFVVYNERYLAVSHANQANHRVYTDMEMAKTQALLEREAASRQKTLLMAGIALGLAGIAVAIYMLVQRKKYRRFQALLQRMEKEDIKENSPPNSTAGKETEPDREVLPKAIRLELLEKLQRFETGKDFTDRSISIAKLAVNMKTNIKYLSHVINNDKKKDFNTYINTLRIAYVINQMKTDPQYLKYKISYMAEDAGFSSHGKFTTVFKSVTGLSPSTFIQYLKKGQQKTQTGVSLVEM